VRVFDVQTQSELAGALTALTHALVVWLAQRHDEGEPLPVHDDHLIRESARVAERDGVGGRIVDLDTGALVPAREVVGALVEQLRPVAREIGSDDLLDRVLGLAAVNGAERQRMVAAGLGMRGLIRWLADKTVERADVRVRAGAIAQSRVLTGP
jgi:glutamate---cysteine ligase / carboxylate-amine ligase